MLTLPNDPHFDPSAVETQVQNLWMQLNLARMQRDLEPLKPYFSADLYAREEAAVQQDIQAGRMRYAARPAVLNCQLSLKGTERGMEYLRCDLLTRYTPQVLDWHTQKRQSAYGETFYREAWTLSRPAGTQTPVPGQAVSVHCPGCGAPLSLYKSAKCPMCGTLTRVPDFSWTIAAISVQIEQHP